MTNGAAPSCPSRHVSPPASWTRVSSRAMTERGLPSVDGAPACPFVAFEDDREARSTSPDHRHRCYAEPCRAACRRAPGGVLPVERVPGLPDVPGLGAARSRARARRGRSAQVGALGVRRRRRPSSRRGPHTTMRPSGMRTSRRDHLPTEEPPIRRNPPRDWAAPPPWAPGGAGSGIGRRDTTIHERRSGRHAGLPGWARGREPRSCGQCRRSIGRWPFLVPRFRRRLGARRCRLVRRPR